MDKCAIDLVIGIVAGIISGIIVAIITFIISKNKDKKILNIVSHEFWNRYKDLYVGDDIETTIFVHTESEDYENLQQELNNLISISKYLRLDSFLPYFLELQRSINEFIELKKDIKDDLFFQGHAKNLNEMIPEYDFGTDSVEDEEKIKIIEKKKTFNYSKSNNCDFNEINKLLKFIYYYKKQSWLLECLKSKWN